MEAYLFPDARSLYTWSNNLRYQSARDCTGPLNRFDCDGVVIHLYVITLPEGVQDGGGMVPRIFNCVPFLMCE